MEEKIAEEKENFIIQRSSKICSDFDDECVDVINPFSCWFGNEVCDKANGLCPLIHTNN